MKAFTDRILGVLALSLAGAALLACGAQAADRPDDRGGMIGVGGAAAATAPTGVFERAVERHIAETLYDPFAQEGGVPVRPDDRPGMRGAGIAAAAMSPAAAAPSGGLTWGDAAFGAAATLGLAVLLGALGMATMRHRGRVVVR